MAKSEVTADKRFRVFTGIGFIIALMFLVVVSFGVGFGASVVVMTPEAVFGADRQGTPLILVALGVGGLCELIALMAAIQAAVRFEKSLPPKPNK